MSSVRGPARGLHECNLEFVCASRNPESFETGSFPAGEIHLSAFRSSLRLRVTRWDCFGFLIRLISFWIPPHSDCVVEAWSTHLNPNVHQLLAISLQMTILNSA
jgi:hypothetical protein